MPTTRYREPQTPPHAPPHLVAAFLPKRGDTIRVGDTRLTVEFVPVMTSSTGASIVLVIPASLQMYTQAPRRSECVINSS